MSIPKRKLIEVSLPLDAINRASVREKSIRHGHPSTLHLWWARRPLAAARAVLFAQLVDDPSAHPDQFPTEEEQALERRRLHQLIEKLVLWENTNDEALYRQAYAEIAKSTGGAPPAILDPFAGGGSIPLEAQRLGLRAHASDLNPVAVLINKALIEVPPRWAGTPPVFPGSAGSRLGEWTGACGLAEDVRRYAEWMRDEAEQRIGHLYPKATLPDGTRANVIAWIWARTVICPNPACGAVIPLASTWWLSKKKDRPAWLRPVVEGKEITFELCDDPIGPSLPPKLGRGAKFRCLVCGDVTTDTYVKEEGVAGRIGSRLIATVAEGERQRTYLPASAADVVVADIARPEVVPDEPLAMDPRNIWCVNYGLTSFADLFTNRQLVALTTFADLVGEARLVVEGDAKSAGMQPDAAADYGRAITLYLAFALDRLIDRNNTICTWDAGPSGTRSSTGGSARTASIRNAFARQSLPMTWDFAEANPFSESGGSVESAIRWLAPALERLGTGPAGEAFMSDSRSARERQAVVSTDPPYYDNIAYADLADFFYVWLRRSLGDVYPELTQTMLTPKSEELVATPYRFGGSKAKAEKYFETGFVQTFTRIRENHPPGIPVTVYYAFKQAESDAEGVASTGWETMLNGLMEAGLAVTATWPIRTELSNRMIGSGTNALASSIVLACRPRSGTAEAVTRRAFIAALKRDLPGALRELQQGSVAPVDLAQAAIGPGMGLFSGYAKVVEADGSDMTVRTALALINQVLDEVLSEQEGDFDSDTRFCVKWFSQFGWDEAESGQADVLARATNTSIDGLVRGGVFRAVAGKARLLRPEDLEEHWDPATDLRVSDWEVAVRLAKTLSELGGEPASAVMRAAGQRRDLDTVKELAYLLFSIAEKRGWTQTAILFNGLGTAWNDLESAARSSVGRTIAAQGSLNFDNEN